ncbi:MAG: SWIM zinc finger family protein [Kouleothrix sp.]
MTTTFSNEQILALAPDASAAKAGEAMASPRKWLSLGCSPTALWGECQGSARDPYRTQIDLRGPAFRCSCPSRKLPCKHSLGLFLLFARAAERFDTAAPPDWAAEWLARRDAQAQKAAATPPTPPEDDAEATARRATSQARTAAAREAKVAAGIEELSRWLRDLVRRGLAQAQSQPASFWNTMAARLIDAQAPGLARRVRDLATVPASGMGWQERMLAQIGQLHLLCASYPRIAQLPLATQADIRTAIGWPQREADLATEPGMRDYWLVLGQRVEEEEQMRTQRTWLWGQRSAQPALVLNFAMFNQPLDRSLLPGSALDAELVFFPSAVPLRAVVRERLGLAGGLGDFPGEPYCADALARYATALAQHPWLERSLVALSAGIPAYQAGSWWLRDQAGDALPLARGFTRGWQLLALSGGAPLAIAGEWDGTALLPLSAWADGEFYVL